MKIAGSILATFFLLSGWVAAQAPAKEPAELASMRKEFDNEVEAAKKPLVDHYVARLESLLKTLTQANDLTGALAVENEIELYRPVGLSGTKWACTDISTTLNLKAGGILHEVWRRQAYTGHWRISGNQLHTTHSPGDAKSWDYTLGEDKKSMTRSDGYIFLMAK